MSYTKNIALIKGVQSGFSADGSGLSGLIKAERYSAELRVEVSLINFAPLTEGRYVTAISDGPHTQIVENCLFEGRSPVDTSKGFAAAVCYVNGGVQLIATAVCGNFQAAAFGLKGEVERAEKIPPKKLESKSVATVQNYDDEAIAGENFYEFNALDEGGQPVCQDPKKEEDGGELFKDEKGFIPVEKDKAAADIPADDGQNSIRIDILQEDVQNLAQAEDAIQIDFACSGFYERLRTEIEGVLSSYPPAEELCSAIEGSKWVKISYAKNSLYFFGVIYLEGTPKYICYAIPAKSHDRPPASMQGLASFLDVKNEYGVGFWVMYQDADTGASIQISPL